MSYSNTVLRSALLVALLAGPCQGQEQEIVWSQTDGLRDEIYYSMTEEGEWEPPEKLTDNNSNNLHPAFAAAPNGSRWVFWSAVQHDGISIEYLVGQDGEWSAPRTINMEEISSAIAPSVLIDKANTVWLVWAGNDGRGQDEIYWSRYRAAEAKWQKPQRINTANQVPDIRPEISLNEQGQMEVRWQGFRAGAYKKLISLWSGAAWSPEQEEKQEEKQEEEEKPVLPEFVPQGSQYVLLDLSDKKEDEQ